jgi:hypothetical protein
MARTAKARDKAMNIITMVKLSITVATFSDKVSPGRIR